MKRMGVQPKGRCAKGPPKKAEWTKTLQEDFEAKPFPDQVLLVKRKAPDGEKLVTSTTPVWKPLELPGGSLAGRAVEVVDVGESQVVVVIRAACDSPTSMSSKKDMAEAVECTFGSDLLGGRPPQNKCSKALTDRRILFDMNNFSSCDALGDQFCKLLPQHFQGHGGNQNDCKYTAVWVRGMFEAAVAYANEATRAAGHEPYFSESAPRSPGRCCEHCCCGFDDGEEGSLKVVRYRSLNCALPPAKRAAFSDMLHMHVDQDEIETVMVLSLGDDAEMLFDGSTECLRLKSVTAAIDTNPKQRVYAEKFRKIAEEKLPGLTGDAEERCRKRIAEYVQTIATFDAAPERIAPRAWRDTACTTCKEVTVHSGDIVLFNGHRSAHIAHAVKGTIPIQAPEGLPDWLKGCRVAIQYRQIKKQPPK